MQQLTKKSTAKKALKLANRAGKKWVTGPSRRSECPEQGPPLENVLSTVPIVIYTAKGIAPHEMISVSGSPERILDFSPEQLFKPDFWKKRIHPDDLPSVEKAMKSLLRKKSQTFEYRFKKRSGKWVWLRDDARMMKNARSGAREIWGSLVDISEARVAQEALKTANEKLQVEIRKRTARLTEANARLKQDNLVRRNMLRDLRMGEERFRILFNSMNAGVLVVDENFRFILVNQAWERMIGYSAAELHSMSPADLTIPGDRVVQPSDVWTAKKRGVEAISLEKRFRRKDGTIFWGKLTISQMPEEKHCLGVVLDISERKRSEAILVKSEAKFRALFEDAGDYILVISLADPSRPTVIDANTAAFRHHGYNREDLVGKPIWTIDVPGEFEKNAAVIREKLKKPGDSCIFETAHVRKDGTIFPVEASVRLLQIGEDPPVLVSIERDITERKISEAVIKASLAEKETLLRELYHRTKNNMQVICSMVELQARQVHDSRLEATFEVLHDRILAMSLVHQKLYQSRNLSEIDLGDYLLELGAMLLNSYQGKTGNVSIRSDVCSLPSLIDVAIPCGLILNELVTNALKYAFPGGREGIIQIGLARSSRGEICFRVSDNGVGFPPGFQREKLATLGLELVLGMAKTQLGGKVSMKSDHGVAWEIRFSENLYNKRV